MKLRVQKLDKDAKLPTKAHVTDAGWDLYALADFAVLGGCPEKIRTGLALEIPYGWFGLICDRSSMGIKGIKVHGGVIDSSYRGEVIVCLNYVVPHEYRTHEEFDYYGGSDYKMEIEYAKFAGKAGDKIAQLVLLPVPEIQVQEVGLLDSTSRGDGGFGSTGR